MKAVIQRVLSAGVEVEGQAVSTIGPGLLVLLGVGVEDDGQAADRLAKKTAELRIFEDEQGRMNRSVLDTAGDVLVVSNFTLCADCTHGRRPEFLAAARPEKAEPLYRLFVQRLAAYGVRQVYTGRFGADMRVTMTGDGPVTIVLDTAQWIRR